MQLADISPVALPRPEDVEGADRIPRALWDGAIERATEELARRTRPAFFITVVLLVAAGLAGRHMTGGGGGVEQSTLIAGLGVAMAGLWQYFLTAKPAATSRWWARFGTLTLANAGLLGGLGAVVTLETGISAPAMLYWLILAGTTAGATATLIPSGRLARAFAVLALAPVALVAAILPDRGSSALALILLAYLVFITLQIGSGGRTYWSAVMAEMLLQVQADSLNRARLQAQGAMQSQELVLEELTAHREAAEQDYAVAARVFQNILSRCCLNLPSIHAILAPLERFNGDVVMAVAINGPRLRIVLGDFTGHGLAAAVGAIPVSEVFFATARRSLPLDVVVREINGKLKKNLPPGLFFAALLADIDPASGKLIFWNGGIPPAFVLEANGRVREQLHSAHPPLGILPDELFDPALTTVDLRTGDRLFVYSDGVVETADPHGELFGVERLEKALATAGEASFSAPQVERRLEDYRSGSSSRDDVTVLEVRLGGGLLDDLRATASSEG